MWTLSSWGWMPNSRSRKLVMCPTSSGSASVNVRRTPLGFPVVPDV
jgi:hypothetical protein